MTIKPYFFNANQFWGYVETKLCCQVPNYMKNLLRVKGLDDPVSFQSIDDSIIEELEIFVRTGGLNPFIPNNATDLKDFFGMFHQLQHKFRFISSHKVLLKYIVAFVAKEIESKGPEFYNM